MYHTNVTEIKIKMDAEEHTQVPIFFFKWMCVFVSFCKLFNQGSSFTKLSIPVWVLCQWRTSVLYFLASHNQY